MGKLFMSHASADDVFVRGLREQLELRGMASWVDSRELRGGDPLWPDIQAAIESAEAFAVVVSPASLQSSWVGRELKHALEVQARRGTGNFRIVPLSVDSTKLGVMGVLFPSEPVYIEIKGDLAGVESAMAQLLASLGKELPADFAATPQPKAAPLEELVLELSDLQFREEAGVRRASGKARLVYEAATPGMPAVHAEQSWRFKAPLGPIEADDLRWYLEKYAIWPSDYFKDRAARVEANLVKWGRMLHEAAMPAAYTTNVLLAWGRTEKQSNRRFSVKIDVSLEAGAPEADVNAAKEAATTLLGLPWELLHDGKRFLFQGGSPTRVRRRLPGTASFDAPLLDTPIRILLVTARPEDESCGYIDHRASALPLVETTEALGGLVKIHILSPATLPALRDELDRARNEGKPYHVVHFDGHGVYDKNVGLGGLCFEHPEDTERLTSRRHETIHTDKLGPLLTDHRIPLVFLEACQTAMSESASESVASELLKVGVASVVAMSHSVLVETARRFVESFYKTLAAGGRVGDAMLAGQRELKDNTFRARIFGIGELRLEDWFVPVLYQEKDDPQLFKATHSSRTQEEVKNALAARMGKLPEPPATGFIGRSRDMLAIERLLRREKYCVVRGQGGEGKTALAAELACWMVRSRQVQRAAFVSVELNTNAAAVVNAIGPQLVTGFEIIATDKIEDGIKHIERALREQTTLLVVDNMESILLPPFMVAETPEALTENAKEELDGILALCTRLNKAGATKIVFTSREPLPSLFGSAANRRELFQLSKPDAVKLVERVLNVNEEEASTAVSGTTDDEALAAADAATEAIEDLVEAVNCNARALTNLAPSITALGITATRESLVSLMAEMEAKFPGSREQSVYASVELSLRRMSKENSERAKVLGVFHGGVNLAVLGLMMQWEVDSLGPMASELIMTGLATPNRFKHLTLNPALCPYLRGRTDPTEREALTARWTEAMLVYIEFLRQQQGQNIELAATLTVLELPGLFALLDIVQRAGDPETTVGLATTLYGLLQALGKPRLLERAGKARDSAAGALDQTWNHAAFQSLDSKFDDMLANGRLREALAIAEKSLSRARTAGERAYIGADYDLAMACFSLGRALHTAGGSEQALLLLNEAEERFEAMNRNKPDDSAAMMASTCVGERGHCLLALGRLDEAAKAYEANIRRATELGNERHIAVGKGQLGSVRMYQRRYKEALEAFADARERFTRLNEPGSVSVSWHQAGIAYQEAGLPEMAEDAYRRSLAIDVQLGNVGGQAGSLNQLGNLYDDGLSRPEEAAAFYQQAADTYAQILDTAKEGAVRSNLGETLKKLQRFDQARREIHRAIECKTPFGHAGVLWKTWAILAEIETGSGNPATAADAAAKARAAYLAYRRAGGENQDGSGRLALDVTRALLAGSSTEIEAELRQLAANPRVAHILPFIQALRSIAAGARDPALAEDARLDYTEATEILVLLETLQRPR
jgi:tetratricopeptide (TPR) repeat protein